MRNRNTMRAHKSNVLLTVELCTNRVTDFRLWLSMILFCRLWLSKSENFVIECRRVFFFFWPTRASDRLRPTTGVVPNESRQSSAPVGGRTRFSGRMFSVRRLWLRCIRRKGIWRFNKHAGNRRQTRTARRGHGSPCPRGTLPGRR